MASTISDSCCCSGRTSSLVEYCGECTARVCWWIRESTVSWLQGAMVSSLAANRTEPFTSQSSNISDTRAARLYMVLSLAAKRSVTLAFRPPYFSYRPYHSTPRARRVSYTNKTRVDLIGNGHLSYLFM